MRYVDLKRNFIRELILRGESSPAAAPEEIRARVPEAILKRWTDRFYTITRINEVPMCPRLVNHFQIGADPEFVFKNGAEVYDANAFQMKAGLCIGADNNGRLVELRPAPSRFALKVVASMLSELRWLSILYPKTTELAWKAGAWSGAEGLGGHIHFGRKVLKQKPFEVKALDNLTALLFISGVYPVDEQKSRQAGQGGYGQFGATRVQAHGYEYRTPPSWLFSPWHAFLALTLAKLVVASPELAISLSAKATSPSEARRRIRNILVQFKGRDDDALIACMGFNVWGLPNTVEKDFKVAWGISARSAESWKTLGFPLPQILPPHIEPSVQETNEVFEYICRGRALAGMLPSAPNWEFQAAPRGYVALIQHVNTVRCPGLGELTRDLLSPASLTITYIGGESACFYIPPIWYQLLGGEAGLRKVNQKYPGLKVKFDPAHGSVQLNKGALTPDMLATTRAVLTEFFPLVRYRDYKSFPREQWMMRLKDAELALNAKSKSVAPPKSVCLFDAKI
jgi:hypothetical protein